MTFVAPGFGPVREVFQSFHDRGWDVGSGFSAYVDGEPVVRLWGGLRDKDAGLPYDGDTLQLVASITKFAESLCIALLVDRGLLQWDDRIADHWPGFADGDPEKARVTVRQLLMHRAGLPVFDRKLGEAELFDRDVRVRLLESQRQLPELFRPEPEGGDWRSQDPAPPQAYHPISRGLYSGELLRKVDPEHRTLGRFFRDELANPLGLDLWIGLPEEEGSRVSRMHSDPSVLAKILGKMPNDLDPEDPRYQLYDYEIEFFRRFATLPDSVQHRALNGLAPEIVAPQDPAAQRRLRTCELPSSNGMGSADAMARLAAMAAGGGALGGVKIFTRPETLREAAETADRYATDGFMLTPVPFTQGGFARLPAQDAARTDTVGWGGAGGQMVRFVPELGLGCAYLTNTTGVRMAMNDPRPNALLAATIECIRRSGSRNASPVPVTPGVRIVE